MNIGIIGLPQSGKKTLFRLLVGEKALDGHVEGRSLVRGVADVQDARFDRLVAMYEPRKHVRARLELVLLPKIEEKFSEGDIFRDMGDIDAFCHLVRAFQDDSIYHMWGSPDPVREVEFVQAELLLHDLIFLEKRLERIDKQIKKAKDDRLQRERKLMHRFQDQLEGELPLRLLELSEPEEATIASYPLLTLRKMIVALNIGDEDIADTKLLDELRGMWAARGIDFVQIAVQAEAEIAVLETASEREEFMREMGIEEPAMQVLTRMCIEAVGLSSFFTVGSDEVRQWFVRRQALAPQAAGVIHSDLERGFIRAEVMKYEELIEAGSEDALKAAGKHHLKGRDYVVEDGDILGIRFNV
ncbi:MAG: redox-regulated ATPase YchF [Candidatus Krumholzibacteriota bacterium]|nr:redox-regulated ATPase YchF [Candidatus Krumholzibacteriota bacterium]